MSSRVRGMPARDAVGRLARERAGQMAVEIAVLVPVVVVVALVVVNLMRFVGACARFDRAAPDAVLSQGVAAAGEHDLLSSTSQVRAALKDAMASEACEVEVSAQPLGQEDSSGLLQVSPRILAYNFCLACCSRLAQQSIR